MRVAGPIGGMGQFGVVCGFFCGGGGLLGLKGGRKGRKEGMEWLEFKRGEGEKRGRQAGL